MRDMKRKEKGNEGSMGRERKIKDERKEGREVDDGEKYKDKQRRGRRKQREEG